MSCFFSQKIKIKIADIVISVTSKKSNFRIAYDDILHGFLSRQDPEVIIRASSGSLPNLKNKEMIFDSGGNWTLLKSGGRHAFCLYSSDSSGKPYAMAVFNSDFRRGEIFFKLSDPSEKERFDTRLHFKYPLDEILMVNLLAKKRGLMVHGCGIKKTGKGLLFVGKSGAGKSTMARLLGKDKKTAILNDDRIIIRKVGDVFYMYGTPWHGDIRICSKDRIRFKNIFFIKHAQKNYLKALNKTDAVARLISRSFVPFWDKKGMEFTMDFCSDLSAKVPCFEFGFIPDKSALDYIRTKT